MGISYHMQKKMVIVGFLLIPVTMLLLFMFYPTARLFQLSVTDWDGYSQSYRYVGLDNFVKIIFDTGDVWLTLRNNAYYFFIHLLAIPAEVYIASLLCEKIKGSQFFKTVTFLPYIINAVAVALMFSFFYSPNGGALNSILEAVGLKSLQLDWLSDARIVNLTLVSVSLWRFCGQQVILFAAAILSIPKELYESADIDGANAFQKYMNITIPGIKTVLELVLFLNVRGALMVFDIPFLMTSGGPGYETTTFMLYTIQTAFQYRQYGTASAMAIILMLIILVVGFVQSKTIRIKGG